MWAHVLALWVFPLPGPGTHLSLHCLWQPEQISGQEVPGVILLQNLGWCLDFKTSNLPVSSQLRIWLPLTHKVPFMPQRWHKISFHLCPEYSQLVHKMGFYGTSKAHNCILSWSSDILIFGQWKYYLFNPQSSYLFCWLYLCYCFNSERATQGEGTRPPSSSRFRHPLTVISKVKEFAVWTPFHLVS